MADSRDIIPTNETSSIYKTLESCLKGSQDSVSLSELGGETIYNEMRSISDAKSQSEAISRDAADLPSEQFATVTDLLNATEILIVNSIYKAENTDEIQTFLARYYMANDNLFSSGKIDSKKYQMYKGWMDRLYTEAMWLREISGAHFDKAATKRSPLFAVETLSLRDVAIRKAGIAGFIKPLIAGVTQIYPAVIFTSRDWMVRDYERNGVVTPFVTVLTTNLYTQIVRRVDDKFGTAFTATLTAHINNHEFSLTEYFNILRFLVSDLGYMRDENIGDRPDSNPAKRILKTVHYLLVNLGISINGSDISDVSRVPIIIYYNAPAELKKFPESKDLNK